MIRTLRQPMKNQSATDENLLIDIEAISIHPEWPTDVIFQFVQPCPYCSVRHQHVDNKTRQVGEVLERAPHCISDAPRKRWKRIPERWTYNLRVASNPFVTNDSGES